MTDKFEPTALYGQWRQVIGNRFTATVPAPSEIAEASPPSKRGEKECITTAEGAYGTLAIIQRDPEGTCDLCHRKTVVLCIDTSHEEYAVLQICEPCALTRFRRGTAEEQPRALRRHPSGVILRTSRDFPLADDLPIENPSEPGER